MTKREQIAQHINRNYNTYLNIVKAGPHFHNSRLISYVEDIFHDVLEEIWLLDEEVLYKKLQQKSPARYKDNGLTYLDGFIIYLLNLNLTSKTSRHFRKYYIKDEAHKLQQYLLEEEMWTHDLLTKEEIESLYEMICYLPLNEYDRQVFLDRWNFKGEKIEKLSYKKLAAMYGKSITYIIYIVRGVEEKIIKNMKYFEELKKFKEENPDFSHKEAQQLFKPLWEEMKLQKEKQTMEDLLTEDQVKTSLHDEARAFYFQNIKGRTQIINISEFYKLYEAVIGNSFPASDKWCQICLTKRVKQFKKALNI